MPSPLIDALMKLLPGQSTPKPKTDAELGIDPDRPWESYHSTPAQPAAPAPPPRPAPLALPPEDAPAWMPNGQPMSPADEALLIAQRRKRIQQALAGGTGNPMPR